jgi:ABC-type antimicrobial peptide transport system permease subunit
LLAVGFLILLAGIINYVNIYTVVVLRRGKELGVKKVFGADRYLIYIQLLIENLLMTGCAIILAIGMVKLTNPLVTNILQFDQIPNIRFDLFLSLSLIVVLPLLTTLYPFLRYLYSPPANSLRNFDKIRDTGSFRQIFLSFQYVVTYVMIIVSLFFFLLLLFMLNTEPGFRTKDIIKVELFKNKPINKGLTFTNEDFTIGENGLANLSDRAMAVMKADRDRKQQLVDVFFYLLNACPLFSCWSTTWESPSFTSSTNSYKIPGGEYKEVNQLSGSENWFRLFDIKLKEGQLYTDDNQQHIIVTESFLKSFGIADFNNAELLYKGYGDKEVSVKIIGVMQDLNYFHLSQEKLPIVLEYLRDNIPEEPSLLRHLLAAIVPGRTQDAIAFLRNLHDEMIGGEFTYSFVEDEMKEIYKEDKKIASIYSVFTFIALIISALGLFSISLFDVQQRRKEIAIRKVNGATLNDVIRLLLKKYFWSLSISFFIAIPIALFAINRYLEGFANKALVSWWLFAIAILLTAGISLLTLIFQTQKAANENPAEVVNG